MGCFLNNMRILIERVFFSERHFMITKLLCTVLEAAHLLLPTKKDPPTASSMHNSAKSHQLIMFLVLTEQSRLHPKLFSSRELFSTGCLVGNMSS